MDGIEKNSIYPRMLPLEQRVPGQNTSLISKSTLIKILAIILLVGVGFLAYHGMLPTPVACLIGFPILLALGLDACIKKYGNVALKSLNSQIPQPIRAPLRNESREDILAEEGGPLFSSDQESVVLTPVTVTTLNDDYYEGFPDPLADEIDYVLDPNR